MKIKKFSIICCFICFCFSNLSQAETFENIIPPYWNADEGAYYVPTNMQCLYDNNGQVTALKARTLRIDGIVRYRIQGNNLVTREGAIQYCQNESRKHWKKAQMFNAAEQRLKRDGIEFELINNKDNKYSYLSENQTDIINSALIYMAKAASMPKFDEDYPIFRNKKCDLVEEVFFKEYVNDRLTFGYVCTNKRKFYITVLEPFK